MKEKLIKLMYHATCESANEGKPGSCPYRKHSRCGEIERLDMYAITHPAEELLASGVTMQQWIPVTERLPGTVDGQSENPNPVLYMSKSTGTIYAGYYGEGGYWRDKYFRLYNDRREGVDADDVLCWMWQKDLPKPPKEK